jgi:HK97 family phage prohead protease
MTRLLMDRRVKSGGDGLSCVMSEGIPMLAPIDALRPHATIAPDGTVEGYASLFGELDQARDMVMPGAFAASLRTRPIRRVPMLFQHDPAEPIGVWLELYEDFRGLYARGRLIPEVVRARELLALLKAGTADGLSIGFRTVNGRLDPRSRVRKLYAIDLWEISIVTFPLLPGARVHAVKEASLALAGAASDQREQSKGSTPPSNARTSNPPRNSTRHGWPVDPSARHLHPARLYRRQPYFGFERGESGLSWRDLVLPEKALRSAARGGAVTRS